MLSVPLTPSLRGDEVVNIEALSTPALEVVEEAQAAEEEEEDVIRASNVEVDAALVVLKSVQNRESYDDVVEDSEPLELETDRKTPKMQNDDEGERPLPFFSPSLIEVIPSPIEEVGTVSLGTVSSNDDTNTAGEILSGTTLVNDQSTTHLRPLLRKLQTLGLHDDHPPSLPKTSIAKLALLLDQLADFRSDLQSTPDLSDETTSVYSGGAGFDEAEVDDFLNSYHDDKDVVLQNILPRGTDNDDAKLNTMARARNSMYDEIFSDGEDNDATWDRTTNTLSTLGNTHYSSPSSSPLLLISPPLDLHPRLQTSIIQDTTFKPTPDFTHSSFSLSKSLSRNSRSNTPLNHRRMNRAYLATHESVLDSGYASPEDPASKYLLDGIRSDGIEMGNGDGGNNGRQFLPAVKKIPKWWKVGHKMKKKRKNKKIGIL